MTQTNIKTSKNIADSVYSPNLKSASSLSCDTCGVRHLALCSPLESGELDKLCSILSKINLSQGETLFYERDTGDYVYNVTSGCVKLYKSLPDGRTQVTGFLLPGDFIGLAPQGMHTCSAEAITDASLCRFWRSKLNDLMNQNNVVEKRLMDIISTELLAAQEQMLLLGRKTAIEKVVSFLMSLSKRAQRLGADENSLYLPMTRSDIADYLGLTTESVSRTFTKLRNDNIISTPNKHTVNFLDPEKLRNLAGEEI